MPQWADIPLSSGPGDAWIDSMRTMGASPNPGHYYYASQPALRAMAQPPLPGASNPGAGGASTPALDALAYAGPRPPPPPPFHVGALSPQQLGLAPGSGGGGMLPPAPPPPGHMRHSSSSNALADAAGLPGGTGSTPRGLHAPPPPPGSRLAQQGPAAAGLNPNAGMQPGFAGGAEGKPRRKSGLLLMGGASGSGGHDSSSGFLQKLDAFATK